MPEALDTGFLFKSLVKLNNNNNNTNNNNNKEGKVSFYSHHTISETFYSPLAVTVGVAQGGGTAWVPV